MEEHLSQKKLKKIIQGLLTINIINMSNYYYNDRYPISNSPLIDKICALGDIWRGVESRQTIASGGIIKENKFNKELVRIIGNEISNFVSKLLAIYDENYTEDGMNGQAFNWLFNKPFRLNKVRGHPRCQLGFAQTATLVDAILQQIRYNNDRLDRNGYFGYYNEYLTNIQDSYQNILEIVGPIIEYQNDSDKIYVETFVTKIDKAYGQARELSKFRSSFTSIPETKSTSKSE